MNKTAENNDLSLWQDQKSIDCIKSTFGNKLNKAEWNTFFELGKASGLNPFLKEMWAVKFLDKPAQIFIGRDGYRKFAIQNKDYDGHIVSSLYSNDDLKVINGKVFHEYKLKNRGNLIGAICTVHKKSISVPVYVSVELREYMGHTKSLWGAKPETMIKKVAEAQALRMAFPYQFNGTYSEYEMWDEGQKSIEPISKPKDSMLKLIIDRLHELGATDDEILEIVDVEDLKEINESHKDLLIQMGKKLKGESEELDDSEETDHLTEDYKNIMEDDNDRT